MKLSLRACLLEASEPIYGRSPKEADDDTILYFVMMIPKCYPKLREQVLDALINGKRKKAVEILTQKIENFSGTESELRYDLIVVRDSIKSMVRGDFKTFVTQQGFEHRWKEENQ